MSSWIDEQPRSHGLSGDHGWDDSDEMPLSGLRSFMFIAAGTAYFGSVWLLSGLAPLPMLVSRLRGDRKANSRHLPIDAPSSSTPNWRNTPA